MKFNQLNKKRICMAVACALVVGGVAVYAGVDGSSDKDNSTASLNAGVSLALNANDIDSIDVTAGVTDALFDTSNVGVTDTNVGRVAQALAEDGKLQLQTKRF